MPRWSCSPQIMTTRWLPSYRLTHTDVCQETPSQPLNARSPTSSSLSTSLKPSPHQRTVISSPLHPPAHVSSVNPRFTSPMFLSALSWRPGFPNIQHSQTPHQDPPPSGRPHTASHHQLKSVLTWSPCSPTYQPKKHASSPKNVSKLTLPSQTAQASLPNKSKCFVIMLQVERPVQFYEQTFGATMGSPLSPVPKFKKITLLVCCVCGGSVVRHRA